MAWAAYRIRLTLHRHLLVLLGTYVLGRLQWTRGTQGRLLIRFALVVVGHDNEIFTPFIVWTCCTASGTQSLGVQQTAELHQPPLCSACDAGGAMRGGSTSAVPGGHERSAAG